MKTLKQLQQIINNVDSELGGINRQNKEQAIEMVIEKVNLSLRSIMTDAVIAKMQTNEEKAIDEMIANCRK